MFDKMLNLKMFSCRIQLLLVIAFSNYICSSLEEKRANVITVYSHINHNRDCTVLDVCDSKQLDISKCSNLSLTVKSIDTQTNCARLYDHHDCSGSSVEILPMSPSHHNLSAWNFGDKARSAGPCRDSCDIEVTGSVPDEPFTIEIFDSPGFRGNSETLLIDGCTPIPKSFSNATQSLKTDHCIQIYDNTNCHINSKSSIELRNGTPNHDDLYYWHFKESFMSVSHCSYKCSQPKFGEITLFKRENFKGKWEKFIVEEYGCNNLEKAWNTGNTTSVLIGIGSEICIDIFDEKDCHGSHFDRINSSKLSLSTPSFDKVIQSMKRCNTVITFAVIPRSAASDHLGNKSSEESDTFTIVPTIAAIISGVAFLIVVFITAVLVIFLMRKRQTTNCSLSEKQIQEFMGGLSLDMEANRRSATANENDYSMEVLAENVPYNNAYEIPRSRIKYDAKEPLGMGEFGIVFKGTLHQETGCELGVGNMKRIPVAVKTVKPGSDGKCLQSLLKEVKVMLFVGKHDNVAFMVGCCTENLRKGEVLVLMEYCSQGSLESYLLKNQHYFKNIVAKGKLEMTHQMASTTYVDPLMVENPAAKGFDYFQLLQWCIDIARGMEFLSSAKVIHSDLAARNVLLTENLTAKISDFGLSRQLYAYSQYVKKNLEPLPWRWMALESLKKLEFSTKSDVWSYGVLCWEIFTLGEKPYPTLAWNTDFVLSLEDGLRLGKPKYATTECYNVMLSCWEDDPSRRPSFTQVIEELEEIKAPCKA